MSKQNYVEGETFYWFMTAAIVMTAVFVAMWVSWRPASFFGNGECDITVQAMYDETWIEVAKLPRAKLYKIVFTEKGIPLPPLFLEKQKE